MLNNPEDREFVCRQCGEFLDSRDLKEGMCPNCGTDEDLFHNDLLES